MSILSDRDILERLKEGNLAIENFEEGNLTPNGYDVTIDEIFYEDEIKKDGKVEIEPLKWFAVSTKEYFRIGSEIAAQLWLRTTWIRKGLIASFGKVDSGFEGNLTLPAFNASQKPLELSIGDRYAQIVFETLSSKTLKSYGERSGRYLGQKGVTLGSSNQRRSGP